MKLTQVDAPVAVGIAGLAVWSLYSNYTNTAPSLADLRTALPDETALRQQLLDCDVLVGSTALLAGGAVGYMTRSMVPVILVALAFAVVSYYHHAALRGPTPDAIERMGPFHA